MVYRDPIWVQKKHIFPSQSPPCKYIGRNAQQHTDWSWKNAAAIFTIFLFHGQVTLFAKNLDFSGSLPSCRPLLVKINHETYASKVFVSWKAKRRKHRVWPVKTEWAGLPAARRRANINNSTRANTQKVLISEIFSFTLSFFVNGTV